MSIAVSVFFFKLKTFYFSFARENFRSVHVFIMHLHVDDFDTDADVAWSLQMSDAHSELCEISKLLF